MPMCKRRAFRPHAPIAASAAASWQRLMERAERRSRAIKATRPMSAGSVPKDPLSARPWGLRRGSCIRWWMARARLGTRRSNVSPKDCSRPSQRHGPDAVAFYLSGQLLTEDYYVANKLMKGFIGSANVDTNSRLCMSSSVAGHCRAFGSDTVPCCYEDIDEADLLVLVGSNAAWCHPVLYQRMMQAREKRGARHRDDRCPRHGDDRERRSCADDCARHGRRAVLRSSGSFGRWRFYRSRLCRRAYGRL